MATLYLVYDRVAQRSKKLSLAEADEATLQKLSGIKGYRYNSKKDHAEFPLTAIWALMYNAPHIHLSPGARDFYEWAEAQANGKIPQVEPIPEKPDFIKPEWKLKPFQCESIAWALKLKRSLWGMDTRLGKTLSALCVHELSQAKRTLVIAPKSTLWNWPKEAEKFFINPVDITVVDGSLSKAKKLKAFEEFEEGVLVVNFETVANTMTWRKGRRGVNVLIDGPLLHMGWDMIVVDEFHLIKNPNAQRAVAVRAMRPEYIIEMSGTPTPNGIHEIWSPLNYIYPEFCPDIEEFEATYCRYEIKTIKTKKMRKNPETGEEEPILMDVPVLSGYTSRVQELHHLLRLYMKRFKYWDMVAAGQIEGYREIPHIVSLTPQQHRLYRKIVEEKGYEYADKKGNLKFQESPLAIGTRLKRICGSLRLIDPEAPIASQKIDAVVERAHLIEEPQVILTQFPDMVRFVSDRLKDEHVDVVSMTSDMNSKQRHEVLESFEERSKGRIFVSTIGICQVGIKLARADTLSFMDATFVPAEMLQATRRVLLPDKERPVTVYTEVAHGTIEERIHRILELKRAVIGLLIDGEIPAEQVTMMFSEIIRQELAGVEEEIGILPERAMASL